MPPDSLAGGKPARPADKPMTRRGCLAGLLIWLVVVTVPFCLVLFAIRGDVSWRRGEFVQDRLWLLNQPDEPGRESAAGVAYSATRPVASAQPGALCALTTVYFLLWRGDSEAIQYCECYQPRPAPQSGYDLIGACP